MIQVYSPAMEKMFKKKSSRIRWISYSIVTANCYCGGGGGRALWCGVPGAGGPAGRQRPQGLQLHPVRLYAGGGGNIGK